MANLKYEFWPDSFKKAKISMNRTRSIFYGKVEHLVSIKKVIDGITLLNWTNFKLV